jgi:pilus assembly protein Flp/PilA
MMMRTKAVLLNGFSKLLGDPEGTSHAEYALILAIIGTAIAFCGLWLSGMIGPSMNEAATCISTSGANCHGNP